MIKKVAEWTQQLQEQMAMDPKDPYYGMLLSRVGCPDTARKMRQAQKFSLGVRQCFLISRNNGNVTPKIIYFRL